MSEPQGKLDLTSLNDALDADSGDAKEKEGASGNDIGSSSSDTTKAAASGSGGGGSGGADNSNSSIMGKSNTLQASSSDSPQTLSPGSPARSLSPSIPSKDEQDRATDEAGAAPSSGMVGDTQQQLDPTSRQIKAMFPDIDTDTIQAVVAAEGGDFERAINTLLQMSDPTYVPPPPSKASSQTERDEQFARSLAAEEQQQAHDSRRRQQSSGFFPPSSRGGLGSLFGGGMGAANNNEQRGSLSPSYDPTHLSYQPRVRRSPSNSQQQHPGPPQMARGDSSLGASSSPNESMLTGWPGPKEAKAWQDDINKLAETGFAKAASTFSALRQRGEQALQGVQQQGGRGQAGPSSGPGGAPAAAASGTPSFFPNWNQRKNSNQTMSPSLGSGRGFDRDASPVSDNELAKILARGRNDGGRGSSSSSSNQTGVGGRATGLGSAADRYKKSGPGPARSPSGSEQPRSSTTAEEEDDDLGWDDAGRTGASKEGTNKPFEPIKIQDTTYAGIEVGADKAAEPGVEASVPESASPSAGTTTRNSVSLMDERTEGRSGTPVSQPKTGKAPTANATASGTEAQSRDDGDDGNSDDLEYVANPFEDED